MRADDVAQAFLRFRWPLLIALVACGKSDPQPVQYVEGQAALESFDSCEALESYIEDTAMLEMRPTW